MRMEVGDAPGPSASFVMCVNRDNPWLIEAIDSVLMQEDRDFEFLIAANDCDDALWSKLVSYCSKDNRIRLFRTAVGQLAFNLNVLANEASGEYLVRMDSDDVCTPQRLGVLRHSLATEAVDILGSAVVLIDDAGKCIGQMDFPITHRAIVRALPTRTVFCHPAVAIRRQFLLDMKGYLGGFASEDTDLWLRAQRAGATMANLPSPLLQYRVHRRQTIMSSIGYAEVAGHWLREWLVAPSWRRLYGFLLASGKAIFARWLPGIGRYRTARQKRDGFDG
ncbi:glycosyltransferase [Devosia sp. Leaf64]|uniref:glycosyltransferase n=1 Tax=Devosia sp. Leaf64 TaxID=1736229 RepID=UPI0009ECA4A9|nr:glycosyltransferase [Devosia sp. Leaf64]